MSDRAMAKGRRKLWPQIDPYYYFCQKEILDSETKEDYQVRLVLETDHPGLFRTGTLEDYPDISPERLNGIIWRMGEAERKKAEAVFSLIRWYPDMADTATKSLVEKAEELYLLMQKTADEIEDAEGSPSKAGKVKRLRYLNREFDRIVDSEQDIRLAYSPRNPWALNFMQIPKKISQAYAMAAIDHIRVVARVDDRDWLAHPVYPAPGRYRSGMRNIHGVEKPGQDVIRYANGRHSAKNKLYYREPHLVITDIIPVPRYSLYRDCLPEAWLEPKTREEQMEAEAARKETRAWVYRKGKQPVPFARRYRKNRN